ncbi:dnaK [Symbiodinium microadriaticum]|nr:dnaK [Symbiodinium microadriaticum]
MTDFAPTETPHTSHRSPCADCDHDRENHPGGHATRLFGHEILHDHRVIYLVVQVNHLADLEKLHDAQEMQTLLYKLVQPMEVIAARHPSRAVQGEKNISTKAHCISGIALLVFGTVGKYVVRAMKRMEDGKEGEATDVPIDTGRVTHEAIASCFGVDIGSTFSRVSYKDEGLTSVLENKEGMRATSCVMHSNNGDTSVGHIASSKKWTNPSQVGFGYHLTVGLPGNERVLTDMKFLPRGTESHSSGEEYSTEVNGHDVSASALRTIFARDLYATASAKILISGVPAVISTPNFFSSTQKMAAINSTRDGGFNCVAAVPDAVGALLGAHHQGSVKALSGKFLVMDVGGYLTQICLVECDPDSGEWVSDTLATHIASSFAKQTGIDVMQDKLAKQRVYDAVEVAKIDLSKSFSTTVSIPYITADASGPKHLELTLSRSTVESLVAPMVNHIPAPLRDILVAANVASPSRELTGFLVVGGGARMPIIRRVAEESIGMTPIVPQQPEDLTATGASLYSTYCVTSASS